MRASPGGRGLRIVLRTGFAHDEATARDLAQAFPGATLSTWPKERSWAEWHGEAVGDFPEDWLLFADGCFPFIPVQAAAGGLRRPGEAPGFTLHSAGLDDLWPTAARGGGGIAQRRRAVAGLPPWWALVERAAFAASAPGAWRSLEYGLAHFGRHAEAGGRPVLALGQELLPFDGARWIDEVFPAVASDWDADWRQWRDLGLGKLPYQYEVARFGIGHGAGEREIEGAPPTFSLLCPAFKPAFIDEMLDSVCGQTYPHWELLVRIDGPPGPDGDILAERLANRSHERRIRWALQENLGTARTRRGLAEEARNDFLVFIDDDDCLETDALEAFAKALDCHQDAGAVRGGATLFGLVERYLPPMVRHTVHGISADLFEVNQPFAVRRELLEGLGGLQGDPEFGGIGEDTDLFLRLEGAGVPVVLVDRPLYRRRISPLNQTLLFDGRGFAGHVRTLAARHLPPAWHVEAVDFREDGTFVRQVVTCRHEVSGSRVHCPTRYFNFHTLGTDRAAWTVLELIGHGAGGSREMDASTVRAIAEEQGGGGQGKYLLAGVPRVLDAGCLEEAIQILAGAGAEVGVLLAAEDGTPEVLAALKQLGVARFYLFGDHGEAAGRAQVREVPGVKLVGPETCGREMPWVPGTEGWTVRAPLGAGEGPWHAAGVCAVAAAWDFYTCEGRMVACPAVGAGEEWQVAVGETTGQEARLLKLGRYRRGGFEAFCRSCVHFPCGDGAQKPVQTGQN